MDQNVVFRQEVNDFQSQAVRVDRYNPYQVYIRVVEDVKEGDFDQAAKTLLACNEAGLEGMRLVTEALAFGRGYTLNKSSVVQSFLDSGDKLEETRISETVIASLEVNAVSRFSTIALSTVNEQSQSLAPVSSSILAFGGGYDLGKSIDFGVIFKRGCKILPFMALGNPLPEVENEPPQD